LEIQEAGSPEIQTAEESIVATIASSAECTSAHVMVYSNSGSVNPPIIIENNNRQLPVMNSDVAEAPGSLERGDHGATVTTDVAGAEHKTRTGHQYTQISRTHSEPVSETLGETSRECGHWMTTAHEAQPPGISEEDLDEQDSFTKLLAEMDLEIEEEAEIEFANGAGLVANVSEIQDDSERDVRTDHPTSILEVQRIYFSEEVQPTRFSSAKQEVPESVTELEPEELGAGREVPGTYNTDQEGPTECKEEILYSDVTTTGNENAPNVGNEEFQRALNLEEIFSFLRDDEETGSIIASSDNEEICNTTVPDTIYEIVAEETTLASDNDVTNDDEDDNGNEFREITGNEFETQPQSGKRREPCHNLGRGEHSATHESSWKENKAYFHLGRLPYQDAKQEVAGKTRLSTGNRSTSLNQQENATQKLPSCKDRYAETRATKRTRNTLSTIGRPSWHGPGSFIRQIGNTNRRHPVSCHQSDLRRWMTSDNIKQCRTFQHPAGSTNSHSHSIQSTKPESYALHTEQLSSTKSSTGAQHQKQLCQLLNNTSLSDRQEDATSDSLVADDDDNNQREERHLQLAADDRRELPIHACRPLISRHAATNEYNQAVLPPALPATNKR